MPQASVEADADPVTRRLRVGLPIAILIAASVSAAVVSTAETPARLTDDEQNTISVFREASRGVVHVESRATTESRFEKGVIEAGSGSGFVIDAEGRILTNSHVISGKNEVDVVLGNGHRLSARLVGTVPQLDIALLQVEASPVELCPLTMGDSRSLQVGQKASIERESPIRNVPSSCCLARQTV